MSIFTLGKNKMAFSGQLQCPHPDKHNPGQRCGGTKWIKPQWINPLMVRYVCKKCGRGVRYDISNNAHTTGELLKMGHMK
jgi:hypothetical protein